MNLVAPKNSKIIVVTGGVLSGIGKGVLIASIGSLLSHNQYKVIPIKCDGYLNADPGTMNPIEHGEVFVLDDGGEVDMDFGHYERFFEIEAKKDWSITMGKIYKKILDDERKGKYLGKTVQLIPHATNEIKKTIYNIIKKEKTQLALIEIGGTVGDIENELFIESIRQMRNELGRDNMMFIHVTYVPFISGSKELKSKPTQNSVKTLQRYGIHPDMIVCRSRQPLNESLKEKISLYCDIEKDHVISGIDVPDVNELPLYFEREGVSNLISKKLNITINPLSQKKVDLIESLKESRESSEVKTFEVAICGKYTYLEDSYASINEAILHCQAHLKIKINCRFINTSFFKENEKGEYSIVEKKIQKTLNKVDGVIIPGGFGVKGLEGKIATIRYLRENNIPFLGICLGMQLAVIEYARNVCNIPNASSREIDKDTTTPVIDFLPNQQKIISEDGNLGASMRLGGQVVLLKNDSLAQEIYGGKNNIKERFRHRYEVNPKYVEVLEKHGMIFSGMTKDKKIMQIVELKNHPFFVGCQFHPELISHLEKPSPLFYHFIKSFSKKKELETLS